MAEKIKKLIIKKMDGPITTTSFIPKTRLSGSGYRPKGFSLGILVSGFILFVSLVFFAGTYFYKQSLQEEVDGMIATLVITEKAFEPELINELSRLSDSMKASGQILENHQAFSKVLKLVGDLTLQETSFSNFGYNAVDKKITVSMSGEAKNYTEAALQAKIFADSEFIESAVFSNLSLKEAGRVNFSVVLVIKPEFIIYKP